MLRRRYQSTHLTDKSIDSGDGRVLATDNGGSSWSTVFDFKMPVIWVARDSNRSGRLYAAAIHSVKGGARSVQPILSSEPCVLRMFGPVKMRS